MNRFAIAAIFLALVVFYALYFKIVNLSPNGGAPVHLPDTPAATEAYPTENSVSISTEAKPVNLSQAIQECMGPDATYSFIGNQISPGTKISTCQGLKSLNQKYILVQQSDGNLVLYNKNTDNPIWSVDRMASNYSNRTPNNTIYQNDYNFVTYNADGQPIWASNTEKKNSTTLVMQEDGNLVIYADTPSHVGTSWSGKAIWASGTNGR